MIKPIKNSVALSIATALSFSIAPYAMSASYKVIDLHQSASHKYTYAQQRNENGESAIAGIYGFNFPVQFEYLTDADFESIKVTASALHDDIQGQISLGIVSDLNDIEDFEALKAGNPTANDLAWTIAYISQQSGTDVYQKIGDTVGLTDKNGVPEEFVIFDKPFENTTDLTRSTIDIVSGITNSGVTYGTGSAPYFPQPFTIEGETDEQDVEVNFWIRDFSQRGFFTLNDIVLPLEPPATEYGGGISSVVDVNEAGIAVGFYSHKIALAYKEAMENVEGGCADPEQIAAYPPEICWDNYSFAKYHLMAFKSTLQSDGSLLSENLGLLVEPHEDDTRPHASYALGVNIHGDAVGYADGWDSNDVQTPNVNQRASASYAVLYRNGEVLDFNQTHKAFSNFVEYSKAYDINDNGLVVGHSFQIRNGRETQKFFYVDTSVPAEEMQMIYPEDFFLGSKSTARSVNIHGQMVGEGEVDTHNVSGQKPRRTEAFLYDIRDESFISVKNLIDCQSEYDVFEARHINDNGDISASAIVKVNRFDAFGQPMYDEDGAPLTEDVVRAVVLEPIPDGQPEDCSLVEEKSERQGASTTFVGLLSLLAIFGFRRKLVKNKK
ncbi:MAG: DUF3466 family protein [Colwellia sp.]